MSLHPVLLKINEASLALPAFNPEKVISDDVDVGVGKGVQSFEMKFL